MGPEDSPAAGRKEDASGLGEGKGLQGGLGVERASFGEVKTARQVRGL